MLFEDLLKDIFNNNKQAELLETSINDIILL